MECVVLKGNQNGLSVVIKNKVDFIQIKEGLTKKLESGRNFFGKNKLSLSFEGIPLDEVQQIEILDLFKIHSDLEIISIIDPEDERIKLREANAQLQQRVSNLEEQLQKSIQLQNNRVDISQIHSETTTNSLVEFHYTTLRSGQQIITDKHVVLIGDVNNGSRIESGGNVIVLGKLKGVVHAGLKSTQSAYVIALDMKPLQIKINEYYGRASDETIHDSSSTEPQVAYVENGRIVIEKFNQKIFKEKSFNG